MRRAWRRKKWMGEGNSLVLAVNGLQSSLGCTGAVASASAELWIQAQSEWVAASGFRKLIKLMERLKNK